MYCLALHCTALHCTGTAMHGMALCGIARHSFMPDSGNTFLRVLQGMPAAFKRVVKHPHVCQQHLDERASRSHAKPGFDRKAKIAILRRKIALFGPPGRNKGPHLGGQKRTHFGVKNGHFLVVKNGPVLEPTKGVERELFLKVIH